ncbi:uncharacterized protein J7T54_000411 [Emericellopsis cladophorae]|uniref:Uncharacterized protein n=1 Tax=Emericellopsis cladophorae TaxID=2686198 RepID=A0A9P9XXD7_9HYPO|nr:uncharacterized protein J7T54_000411 [Emericellopsis cladophorae]KAI6779313.1 hypothetical protein J7T54_000411 [Emericellopsis cladophorae]
MAYYGLYWLDDKGAGTHYTMRRNTAYLYRCEVDPKQSLYLLTIETVSPVELRMKRSVVIILQVFGVPRPLCDVVTTYLVWLLRHTARTASRTFIWAATGYVRSREHTAGVYTDGDDSGNTFVVNGFLREALGLAHSELGYAIGGQVPRPVIVSRFAVTIVEEGRGESEGHGEEEETQGPQEPLKTPLMLPMDAWPSLEDSHRRDKME